MNIHGAPRINYQNTMHESNSSFGVNVSARSCFFFRFFCHPTSTRPLSRSIAKSVSQFLQETVTVTVPINVKYCHLHMHLVCDEFELTSFKTSNTQCSVPFKDSIPSMQCLVFFLCRPPA